MSRSNNDKPFYVDVGTSIVAIRCASNHDVIEKYDYVKWPFTLELAKEACDRMNKEVEISKPLRNCDVGTVDEQEERFCDFCNRHTNEDAQHCNDCPINNIHTEADCVLVWSQMPYEETKGEAK